MNVDDLPPEQQKLLLSALESRALLLRIEGAIYAARRDEPFGWWIWELKPGSTEYFVDRTCTHCTCKVETACKHAKALKYGGEHNVAWDYRSLRKRRKVRNANDARNIKEMRGQT